MADDQQRRHAALEIVLGDECLEDAHFGGSRRLGRRRVALVGARRQRRRLDGDRVLDVLREGRPISEVAAAAHHRQVDAGAAAVDLDPEHIGVDDARRCCPRPPAGAGRAPASRSGCPARPPAELQRLGARHHLRLGESISSCCSPCRKRSALATSSA
jgi:hypothetical protein